MQVDEGARLPDPLESENRFIPLWCSLFGALPGVSVSPRQSRRQDPSHLPCARRTFSFSWLEKGPGKIHSNKGRESMRNESSSIAMSFVHIQ